MRWIRKESPKTNFRTVQQENQDEQLGVIIHMTYMPSETIKMCYKKMGVIFYQPWLIGCDISNVNIA